MKMQRWATRIKSLPHLLTPPLFSLMRSKWRDRDRQQPNIPDHHLYKPIFSPWLAQGEFGSLCERINKFSLVSRDRLWVLYGAAKNAARLSGDFVECGVYKGGTAYLLAQIEAKRLHLFDTFTGMPTTNVEVDKHRAGDFSDTSLALVKCHVGESERIFYYPGCIPETFSQATLKKISLLHVDMDIYDSIFATLTACYDKVVAGGFIVFDDYGFESCYGARLAVDKFFATKPEWPISLATGQALVIKSGQGGV